MRHLRKAFHALRMQEALVIVLASEIILKGDGLQIGSDCRCTANDRNAYRLGSEALQERELLRSKGDLPIGKHHLAFTFPVLDQTGVFVCMTKHNKFSPFANARANTSFIGKSRATCRKENSNCWSDSSDHDLGRDIENASIPRKNGSIEWGEKTTIYPFLKLSKNFILRARATDIFSSGISPSKTNMVFTLLCSTLTDCSAFNIALYFTHW